MAFKGVFPRIQDTRFGELSVGDLFLMDAQGNRAVLSIALKLNREAHRPDAFFQVGEPFELSEVDGRMVAARTAWRIDGDWRISALESAFHRVVPDQHPEGLLVVGAMGTGLVAATRRGADDHAFLVLSDLSITWPDGGPVMATRDWCIEVRDGDGWRTLPRGWPAQPPEGP